ncbi:hypothetical protein B0H11DRAFT_1827244 [Mycena galericulata]|nr:hypothetical protein B0H11DRAFT_1827244 [Mycena galericulata]
MSTQIQDGPAPFSGALDPEGNIPDSDFIIRCGDGVDLHAHKSILQFVSVFFKNMLDGTGATNPTDLRRDGKPVVELPEPSSVLYRLLCIAYPGRSLEHYSLAAQNLDGVWAVHEAANKYLFMGVQELLEKMLADPVLLEAHPHRVFAIARLRDLPELARKAALYTLKSPVCPPGLLFPETQLLSAAIFQNLHEFHHACGKEAERLVKENSAKLDYTREHISITHAEEGNYLFVWWKDGGGEVEVHTGECEGAEIDFGHQEMWIDISPAQWFKSHVERLATKLRSLPTRCTVKTEACVIADADREIIKSCKACRDNAEHDLINFRHQLGMRIEASNNAIAALF